MAIKLQGTNSAAAPGLTNDGGDGVVVGTDTVDISIGGASKVKVDSSGRVLVGATTEGNVNADDLTVETAGHTGITVRSGTSNQGSIYFSDATSGAAEYAGWIRYDHSGNNLTLGTNETERIRIQSDGVTSIPGGIELGSGLDGTAANTMDDYEEGTFTPTWAQGINVGTYTIAQGNYTKIGRYVYGHIYLYASVSSTNGDQLRIGGLPFTSGAYTNVGYGGANNTYTSPNMFSGISDGGDYPIWHIMQNNTLLNCYNARGGGVNGNTTGFNPDGKEIILSFYYHTA